MTNNSFELAGSRRTVEAIPEKKKKWYKGKPVVSVVVLRLHDPK